MCVCDKWVLFDGVYGVDVRFRNDAFIDAHAHGVANDGGVLLFKFVSREESFYVVV